MADPTDGLHETFRAYDRSAGPSNRSFGFTLAALFAALCGVALWREGTVDLWLPVLAVGFLIVTLTAPGLLAPLNRAWNAFGRFLHTIMTPVLLAILFYGMITPMGALSRLFGHDPLRRRIDRTARSYWIDRPPPGSRKSSMRKQF